MDIHSNSTDSTSRARQTVASRAVVDLIQRGLPEPQELFEALRSIPLQYWSLDVSAKEGVAAQRIEADMSSSELAFAFEVVRTVTFVDGTSSDTWEGEIRYELLSRAESEGRASPSETEEESSSNSLVRISLTAHPQKLSALFDQIAPHLGEVTELEARFSRACEQARQFSIDRAWAVTELRKLHDRRGDAIPRIDLLGKIDLQEFWRGALGEWGGAEDQFEVERLGGAVCYQLGDMEIRVFLARVAQIDNYGNEYPFGAGIVEVSDKSGRTHRVSTESDFNPLHSMLVHIVASAQRDGQGVHPNTDDY